MSGAGAEDPVGLLVAPVIRALAERGALPRDLAEVPLSHETELDALGIDSLGKLTLLSELEERASITLSESLLVGLRTLGDLARVVVVARRGTKRS